MQTAMVTYIVFGIFIYSRGYLDYEPSRGAAFSQFSKNGQLSSLPGAVATHVHGNFVAVSSGRPKVRYFTAEVRVAVGKKTPKFPTAES